MAHTFGYAIDFRGKQGIKSISYDDLLRQHPRFLFSDEIFLCANNLSVIPSELCLLPNTSYIDFTHNNFTCYPSCYRKAQWILDPMPHCPGSYQDQIICAISEAFDMPSLMDNLEMKSSNITKIASPHPRDYTTIYTLAVAVPEAFAYDITFDGQTSEEANNYIQFCTEDPCTANNTIATYGSDKGLFPGVLGNKPLHIIATRFFIYAGSPSLFSSDYGFTMFIAPSARGLGWKCTYDSSSGLYYAEGLCDESPQHEWTDVDCLSNLKLVSGLSLSALGAKGLIPTEIAF